MRPSYSKTMVPSCCTWYWLARDGDLTASMYSTVTCFEAYWYSSRRSRNRAKSSAWAKTLMLTGFCSPSRILRVWSDSVNCLAAVRSQRLLCRDAEIVQRDEDGEHDQGARGGQRAESRLASGERARDFAPLTEHVEQRADQARDREAEVPLLPFRFDEADGDSRRTRARRRASRRVREFSSTCSYPRHLSLSTDLAVRNKPERDEAQVVDQVLGVDDAAGEIVEVIDDREMGEDRPRPSVPTARRSS